MRSESHQRNHAIPSRGSSARRRFYSMAALLWLLFLLTRIWALSSSPWEWDEILFLEAMEDYDVALHKPHPPGYPLFIAAAHLVRPFAPNDFRALQLVTLIGAAFLPAVLWRLLEEIGFSRRGAASGAVLTAFTPTVWFYGGTAFSDVPALCVTLAAALILLKKRGDLSWIVSSGLAIAAVAAFRPQNVLILLPFLCIALVARGARQGVAMISIATLACSAIYVTAIAFSSPPEESISAMTLQANYVLEVDSVQSPTRMPMREAFRRFFLRPYPTDAIAWSLIVFGIGGLWFGWRTNRKGTLTILVAFLPLTLLSLLLLDVQAASRYSVSYVPALAIFVALALEAVARLAPSPAARSVVRTTLLIGITLVLVWRTIPAIAIPRSRLSPPLEAVQTAMQLAEPGEPVLIDGALTPFALHYLPRHELFHDSRLPIKTEGVVIGLGDTLVTTVHRYSFADDTLRRYARQRYFDVWVDELDTHPRLGDGWFGLEKDEASRWSWMGGRGEILMPGADVEQCFTVDMMLPQQTSPGSELRATSRETQVLISPPDSDGRTRIRGKVAACHGCIHELDLEVTRTFRPDEEGSGDTRVLGARLTGIGLGPCATD
ncbi:MAG: glycosyltransferase family 39 protein [Acidobacteria bacterium]|nr:glycosyltransferase family 39 protein [Acidobacteriota bacterium]